MSQDLSIKSLLSSLSNGQSLSGLEAEFFFNACFDGTLTPAQIAAGVMGMRLTGENAEILLAGAKSLRARLEPFSLPFPVMDTCGTGGDGAHTVNISTTVAFVLAGANQKIAKHGGRASSSRSGSSDVLHALGVNLLTTRAQNLEALNEAGLCFLFAPHHHQAMKHAAPIRAELGIRTVFNLLGPLANPAFAQTQILGTFDKIWLKPMAEVLKNLGVKNALCVHGSDGLDEVTLAGETYCVKLDDDGRLTDMILTPDDFGLRVWPTTALKGGDATDNAHALKKVLDGEKGAYRDVVIANSAAALWISNAASSLKEGVKRAQESIDSGRALNALQTLVRISHTNA